MRRRTAATLIEVLVAIFVMSIGLLALLTLFPLGALSMAQAIKDDRTAHAAANAEALALTRDLRHDPSLLIPADLFTTLPGVPTANPDGPSFPIYLDPLGTQVFPPGFATWVGGPPAAAGLPGIPRRSVSFLATTPALPPISLRQSTLRWFTLLDDLTFDAQGGAGASGGTILRDGKYSWAYLLKRPRSSVPSVVDLTVVVYSQRPLNLTAGLVPAGETTYPATGAANANAVTLRPAAGQEKPAVRKGDWILDASISPNAQIVLDGPVHGYFYRVVGVTEVGATVELELQTNLRAAVTRVVVMEGVAEVFDKGAGSVP